jgi:cytoskeletal protein RodZ
MTQTIGQKLRAEREAQKLTLEKVFEVTRIRVPYLQALEDDNLSRVPSPVQARGYLRNYAEYLGLNFQQLLDEMRVASQQQASGEVIGPADDTPTLRHTLQPSETATLDPQPATQTREPSPALASDMGVDTVQEQSVFIEEVTPLVSPKPKPVRRKKTEAQSEPASTESKPKRRGRKKIEPEPKPVPVSEAESPEAPQDRLEPVEVPVTLVEPIPPPEPPAGQTVNASPESTLQTEASDSLWQTWLKRLSSVLSARMKRHTLVQRQAPDSQNDPEAGFVGPENVAESDNRRAPVQTQNLSLHKSSEIFKEIGVELRVRRELLSLHLDEVERNTHVKAHYIEALEKGVMDELPSTVQTRGMLSNYATFLDMDVDALLLRFADGLQARHRERNPQKPARKPGEPIIANVPPIRTFIAGDIIFGIGIAVLLVGFAIWGVSRVVAIQSQQEVQLTAPSISDVLLASPDPSQVNSTATLQPVESFPGLVTVTIVIPTQDVNVEVQINLIASERTYMRVVVDGEVAFDGRTVPGNAYPFQSAGQIEVLVGSGAAIRVVYNGRDMGLMGSFGQVARNIYTASEIITPTALASPTGASTVTPTLTISPTTLSSTNTPAPSSTPSP